jgi:tRNA uridine 5-carboxymethylaminomethyl modification enzyme
MRFDIVVAGGGHAGVEAVIAAQRMGASVALVTTSFSAVGRMSCNPAIGGLAKGHLVKEIDALGGEMGLLADKAGIQFKVLNKRKGPAVWSSRAQADRELYEHAAQQAIKALENVEIIEDNVIDICISGDRLTGIITESSGTIPAKSAILAGGTFLNAIIHTGAESTPAGRVGEPPVTGLSDNLAAKGFAVGRLKTGTPPRIDGKTVDFSAMQSQPGDEPPRPFSVRSNGNIKNRALCHIVYTNEECHQIIRENIGRSPLFNGQIKGIGPRYCPSIEDKVVKFTEKPRHQLFLEPEGLATDELYVNGFSSSLPADVQLAALRAVPGMESVHFNRPGYAVEYDFFPPTQLKPTLETKAVENLYFAGQVNGTSGYEEAAAQGLMAAINGVLKVRGKQPFVLDRSEAYIGVMIDDLVTRGVDEPYRMFTSRAEHRLHLREDNADERLTEYGYRLGLVSADRYGRFSDKYQQISVEKQRLGSRQVPASSIPREYENLRKRGSASMAHLLKIPGIRYADLAEYDDQFVPAPDLIAESVQIQIKYAGYIQRQLAEIARFKRNETIRIPEAFLFDKLVGLRTEAREKFSRIRPVSLGQAARISGITGADIALLLVHLKASRRHRTAQHSRKH